MKDFPFPLVVPISGEARASSEIIARGVELPNHSVMTTLRRHKDDFESFGKVELEVRLNRRGSPTEFAMLNEHQATLLLNFMRNSPKVIASKVALVKEFFRMRDELGRRTFGLGRRRLSV